MSFIKVPPRDTNIEQDNPLYYTYETTQSMELSFDVINDGGLILANSSDVDSFDRFNITVDQLEGELTIPFQLINKLNTDSEDPFVERRILVPNSLLGGFTQFRINYTFIEFPEAGSMAEGENVGTFFSDSFVTDRILVPRYVAPPEDITIGGFFVNPNDIREALADKMYDAFFNSAALSGLYIEDIKSLQTTISEGQVATGRINDSDPLIFYKKDRNTPQNKIDFNSGVIDSIVTDISGSLAGIAGLRGEVNVSNFLDDEISVLDPKISPDIIPSDQMRDETLDIPEYYYQTTTIEIQYKDFDPIPFASYQMWYNDANAESPYTDPNGVDRSGPHWTNVLNLSQMSKPITAKKIDPTKAKDILDSEVFELLPPQRTRQDDIDDFFQDFQNLIGGQPSFEDVDEDGAGEQLISDPASRISQNPNDPAAMITRTDDDADAVNEGKTLESMRNQLNTYLGDVDNVVEEPFDERPEYINKSVGFLKLRRLNQAIIIRSNTDINSLEKESSGLVAQNAHRTTLLSRTGPSWMVDGFTITMWVRFTDSTTDGTLFTYGNPFLLDEPAFRLETLVRPAGNLYFPSTVVDGKIKPDQRFIKPYRIVRLLVWDTNYSTQDPKLYESSFPRNFAKGYVDHDNAEDGGEGRYSSIRPRIPKFDTSGRPDYGGGSNTVFGRTSVDQYYFDAGFVNYTHIPTDDLNEWFFICATYNPRINEDYCTFSDTDDTIYNIAVPHTNVNYPVIGNNTASSALQTKLVTHFWLNQLDFDPDITEPVSGITVGQSGYGNRCKVEVISRSDLLRARGFKVDE